MTIRITHSGNIGDIIYSLPAMRSACELHGKQIIVQLQTNIEAGYANNPNFKHPSGRVMLTTKGAEMLKPFLNTLVFIDSVEIADSFESCDYDFDRIRKIGLHYSGSISRWYFYAYPQLTCDLSKRITPLTIYNESTDIVINRSERYHNPTFDYRVLLPIQDRLLFVGLENEYEILKRKLPEMRYRPVGDFLDMYHVIAGSELFIGNQSMAYALAEITGQNRILEVCPTAHNCIPMTPNGIDCVNLYNLVEVIKKKYGKA